MASVALSSWVGTQKQSSLHKAALGLFGLMIFMAYLSLAGLIVGYIVFFLATSLSKVWKMLIFMAVIALVLAVLPFLAPLAIILMIILFIMRIGYVIENWKPIVAGLAVYGMVFPLYQMTAEHRYWGGGGMEPLIVAALGAAGLHFLLLLLYKEGYSTKTALGIMGSVPLVVLAFILPFLKLHIPVADTVLFEGAPVEGAPIEGTPAGHSSSSSVPTEPVIHSTKSVAEPIMAKTVTEPIYVKPTHAAPNETLQMKTGVSTGLQQTNTGQINSGEIASGLPKHTGHMEVYRAQDNIFGGKEITNSQGSKIMSTRDNIFNGEDLFTPEGEKLGSTRENIFNGHDLFDENNSKIATTHENFFGGEDIYDENNQKIASTRDNGLGTKEIYDKNGQKIGSITES